MISIGKRIKQLRTEKGMTQDDLADATHITKAAISRYELGQRQPSLEQLEAIADALDVWVFDLVNLSPEKQDELLRTTKMLSRIMGQLAKRGELESDYVEMLEIVQSNAEERIKTALLVANAVDKAQNDAKMMMAAEEKRKQAAKEQKQLRKQEKKRQQRIDTLLSIFRQFSDEGQEKVIELVRMMAKAPGLQRQHRDESTESQEKC